MGLDGVEHDAELAQYAGSRYGGVDSAGSF
jgi:hypothetical protein